MQSLNLSSVKSFLQRKEFGDELLAAIKLCGGIEHLRALREQSAMRTVKVGQLTKWQKRERELVSELRALMMKLSDSDAADIANKYKWVAEI